MPQETRQWVKVIGGAITLGDDDPANNQRTEVYPTGSFLKFEELKGNADFFFEHNTVRFADDAEVPAEQRKPRVQERSPAEVNAEKSESADPTHTSVTEARESDSDAPPAKGANQLGGAVTPTALPGTATRIGTPTSQAPKK